MPDANRIGFDARLIGALGIGRYISGLLPPIADLLDDRLIVIASSRDAALVHAMVGGRARVEIIDAAPYRLAEQTRLLTGLLRLRLRLVHFPHYNLPLAFRDRFVVTIHDLFSYRFPEIHSGPLPRTLNRALIRNAVARAKVIVTPSQATAAELWARFPQSRDRTACVAEATDERFGPVRNPESEAAWQRYLGIRPPYILYLGQWKTYKNLAVLIQAFEGVLARRPDAQLVIAGSDPRHPEIPQAAARLPQGAIALPGRVPDEAVADLYRGAAAVALPSLAEGFGLPALEAMACGVRLVCSDVPPLREIADGVASFCPPTDAACFTGALLGALEPPAGDQRPALGIARAQTYSWRKAAEETVAIYERALDS